MYNYIIIGGGPSGLTLSYLLGKTGKKCLIIDKNESVGGCHTVIRVNGLFTEHSPRIYSDSYKNMKNILKMMELEWDDFFTPYLFGISNIGGNSLNNFTLREKFHFGKEYIKLMFNSKHGWSIPVLHFMIKYNFSNKAKDYVDRLCRLSDGAGSDRYTLYQFLQLINQEMLYTLYQPKKHNEIGLFPAMVKKMENVEFKLKRYVKSIDIINSKIILENNEEIYGENIIIALPPLEIYKLNMIDVFPKINKEWVKNSTYIQDIPVIFHWDTKLNLGKVWGFPKSEWGIAFIVLSDYMKFDFPKSQTVITTCITMVDSKSKEINKTANEVETEDILKKEVFRQLKISFPNLPEPTFTIIQPGVKRNNGKWTENFTAYIKSYNSSFIPFQSPKYKNIYNLGTHNGKSQYAFTSFESAAANAISLYNELDVGKK